MPDFGNLVQKAFYLGMGLASYAGEKASTKLQDLRTQAQKLADEMVKRGEMSAEDASQWVDDILKQAQQPPTTPQPKTNTSREPRRIEIVEDGESTPTEANAAPTNPDNVETLRQQVQALQEELRRLQQE
jgi:polyhydroxyalkanoate synthesis regulator phasin